jgi:hypothetical protein
VYAIVSVNISWFISLRSTNAELQNNHVRHDCFGVSLICSDGDMGVRQSGTMALHTRAAAVSGYGLGEAQAALKTIQSAVQLSMPVAYGKLYALHPSSPWVVAGLLAAYSQMVFSMLSEEELKAIDQPQRLTKQHRRKLE